MRVYGLLFLATCLIGQASAQENVTECDKAAAHPSDPDKITVGVPTNQVVTQVAIPACRAALAADPENARLHYQLGRAIYYWSEANDGDPTEGIAHVRHAAERDYPQAMFVLGLLLQIQGDKCAPEPLTKRAADLGLKSARLSYVNSYLAGNYDSCGVSASFDEMKQYLLDAKTQMSGYYENMLLQNLEHQLDQRAD